MRAPSAAPGDPEHGAGTEYVFGPFRFDAAACELSGPDGTVRLRPQAAAALQLLLANRGRVVSRTELRRALWPDSRVVLFEASIAAVIRELRRALGDHPRSPRYIETVPKRGYRFVAPAAAGTAARGSAFPPGKRGGFLRISAALFLAFLGALASDRGTDEKTRAAAVTVAVLPFEAREPGHRELADGLRRELVGLLGAMAPGSLRIVDGALTDPENGGGRPVDFTLSGSVADDAGAALATATLLGAPDGRFAWGERYRREVTDTSLEARALAAVIAESVAASALPQWSDGTDATTADTAAAAAFRRGSEALARLSPEAADEAVTAFRAAIARDPEFSAAHAHLAVALTSWQGPDATAERIEEARQAAERAIELLPTNAVAHRVLGELALWYDRDWGEAGALLERSLALAPANASGHHSYANWLSARGRHDDARREIDLAAALDPESVAISVDVMFLHYYARDFRGTLDAARRLARLWPGNEASPRYAILAWLGLGDRAAAAAEARTRLARHRTLPEDDAVLLSDDEVLEAYWQESLRVLERYVDEEEGDPAVLAVANVQLGRLDAAVEALRAAHAERRFSYYLPYLGVSPALDPLCGHPGFEELLRDLKQVALGGVDPPRCAGALADRAAARG
jgi:DNA-binding winged helix-turn-helix (wHTH) protein/tetratricopeptide (TPR) repeat protein